MANPLLDLGPCSPELHSRLLTTQHMRATALHRLCEMGKRPGWAEHAFWRASRLENDEPNIFGGFFGEYCRAMGYDGAAKARLIVAVKRLLA